MKKNFSKIILCAFALCTCVFSLSFGIYAVMSAKMNTAITVGYMAYNCSANISAVITGASTEAEGEIADITLDTVAVNGKNKQTANMNFGTFYFSTIGVKNALGKPYPIKIWFTIENTSDFDICVDVSLPTITDVEVVADKTSHAIPAGKTDTIMVTFTVTNANTTALEAGVSSTDLSLTLKKFLKNKADIPVYKDSTVTHFENHPYYIEYGSYGGVHNTEYWLVGGTIDANGQTVALTEADKAQLDTGKFDVNKDYYIISAYGYYFNNQAYRCPVQNNCSIGTDYYTTDCYLYEYPQINEVYDYSLSTVRQYLNGYTVYYVNADTANRTYTQNTSIVSGDLLDLYNLNDSVIYPLIQKRSLSAIYKTLGLNNTEKSIPTDKVDNLSANEADAFWLPTAADIAVLGDDYVAYQIDGDVDSYYCLTQARSGRPLSHFLYAESISTIYEFNIAYKYRPAFIL